MLQFVGRSGTHRAGYEGSARAVQLPPSSIPSSAWSSSYGAGERVLVTSGRARTQALSGIRAPAMLQLSIEGIDPSAIGDAQFFAAPLSNTAGIVLRLFAVSQSCRCRSLLSKGRSFRSALRRCNDPWLRFLRVGVLCCSCLFLPLAPRTE